MKKFLATMAVACAAFAYAAPAQAVTSDLIFSDPTTESGTEYEVGSVYRYTGVTAGVDMLLTINSKSDAAVITDIFGNAPYFTGDADNFQLQLTRVANSGEANTFVNLGFEFVETGTTTATSVTNTVLTFADIDSETGQAFSDYVQFDPTQFNGVLLSPTTALTAEAILSEVRYIGPFDALNVPTTEAEQADVSVNVLLNGVSSFDLTWGYLGAGNFTDRGLLIDGSNELRIGGPVPEPASAALLGMAGMLVFARVNGRSSRRR